MKVLSLVGTGIKTISHITEETKGYIKNSDKVLYLVNEPLLESYIKKLAKLSESLESVYFEYSLREYSYENIAKTIHNELEKVNSLCVVIYGHPCVFATPGLLALCNLDESIKTIVCPGISAQDCLYADLRFDPACGGVQTLDATDYLLYDKLIDKSSHLIIYQIGMVGNLGLPINQINFQALRFVKEKLEKIYGKEKKILTYESAIYPGLDPIIFEFDLNKLDQQDLTSLSTLYIPPEKKIKKPSAEALKLLNPLAVQ